MTLQAVNLWTNEIMRCVAVPLELADWMSDRFDGKFIRHLHQIDPYKDVPIPKWALENPIEEFSKVRDYLKLCARRGRISGVPKRVDICGNYGTEGALRTIKELLEFFDFVANTPCKVLSSGD